MKDKNPYLLPQNVEPTHYEIALKPNLSDFTFSGSEQISIDVKQRTSQITLHALDLKIKSVRIAPVRGGEPVDAKRITWNQKMETATVEFAKPLKSGPAKLSFEFEGELNDKMHGFYRTSYQVNGEKRWGAATQFEATDARRVFPCWDEPARKATFGMSLTIPKELTALSNMPAKQESDGGSGWKTIRFKRTSRMSTYLLAVVIAELEHLEGADSRGVPIRVFTSPGKREQGRFALEQACHTLAYFADWFGIPYAFPKLDMVALPDFAAGAMENWGLVTYRETALLVDPKNSSASARQRVADVVDHELAHQWFGNYTTMKWWTDLWLNEGFASYMGPKATDHNFPKWDKWTQYIADEYFSALHEDCLRNTHPVEVPVKNPHEIREVFDAISYSKGSVVNRMVNDYLGEESFRKGLHKYLKRYAFGNAATDDLWKALEETSGKPIRKMMAGYTRQPGYPIVLVREQRKNGDLVLELEQKRFQIDGSRDPKGLLWQIPIGVLGSGASQPKFEYMKGRRHKFAVPAEDDGWLKLNPGQSGFYRVAYSDGLRKKLAGAIRAGAMPTVDRMGILDDAFALARAGYLKTSGALDVLKAYEAEEDFSVWLAIAGVWGSLDNLLSRERFRNVAREAAREFFQPIAARTGWEKRPSDGHLDVMLRALALRNLGAYGDQPTIEEARRRFVTFRKQGELDPDLRQPVYSLVAENGGEKEWSELLEIYSSTDLHEEKVRVLRAAGNFREPSLIQNLLEFSLSDRVRAQDTPIMLAGIASNAAGRSLAWTFLKKNWKTFVDRYHGGGIGLLSRMIAITQGFTTAQQAEDVRKFFQKHTVLGTERAVRKTGELIRSNVAWLERDRKDLKGYFA